MSEDLQHSYMSFEDRDPLFPVKKDGKWGYMDSNGKLMIEPQFARAEDFFEDRAVIAIDVAEGSHSVTQFQFKNSFTDKPGISRQILRYSFIDKSGELIAPPEFDYADHFSEGLAMVRDGTHDDGVYGYIDKNGNITIEPQFDYHDFTKDDCNFSEGLAPVKIDHKVAYINQQGDVVFRTDFDHGWNFSEGMAVVRNGDIRSGVYGYINKEGKTVIKPRFRSAAEFNEGLAVARADGWERHKWGYINQKGDFVIPPKYTHALSFKDDQAWVFTGDLAVAFLSILSMVPLEPFISGTWEYIWKNQFKSLKLRNGWVGQFHEGLASRKLAGQYTYIDKSGKELTDKRFDIARDFRNGLARVRIDNKWGYIDRTGRYVWKPSN